MVSWMLSLLLSDCSPLVLVSRPRVEVWFCLFLYYISLKKLFSPVQIALALDITVLPQGTISGCSLEAVPRSLLALANLCSALLLFSQRISYGSNALGLLWTDPSAMHQQMERVICIPLTALRKAEHPLLLLSGIVQLLCFCLAKPRLALEPGKGSLGSLGMETSFQAELLALLLPLVTLTTHPDGNCSPSWKSCLFCCGTCAPKQLKVFGQCSQPFPQGK